MKLNKGEYKTEGNKQVDLFTIDCGDILLREFTIQDAEAIYMIAKQPEVSEFLPDWKSTKEQRIDWVTNYEIPANKEFLKAANGVPNIGEEFLKLGVFLKENNEFIGWCCTGIKEELPSPNREVMYAISNDYRNKGYATRATKGLMDYLFEKTNVEVLNTIALVRNIASNKVIEKSGFPYVTTIEIEGEKYNWYKIRKSEWIGNHS
ncbi:GNAT family N-acetyltransferase [Bacillus clarus]|uniref:Acetyltransferase family protein n=1 Tax=Bacillus clarus TaxID=2338372 RepID=A0A090YJT0_9BACI|nr:GNAT family N-acetyltransferase [Bacillus clarus]KFM99053.1 acetyltransferase family protein [Bacillus clarus]